MADDIDIEEHDILDNPRIQDILHIKEEPVDLDADHTDQYEASSSAYNEYNQYEYYTEENYDDQQETDDQIHPHDQETNDQDQESSEVNQETEFNEPDVDIDESALESDKDGETEYIPDLSEIYHHKNKIILGSKPCQTKRPERDVNAAYVSLEDWRVRLENSHCYCKECKTLFATRNALDAHNMLAHSFLVAVDSPGSSEPETSAVLEQSETAKYCDHCKKYFPNDHALIQHLYDLITANKAPPTPIGEPNSLEVSHPVKYRNCTNSGQHDVFCCTICNTSFLDTKWCKSHARNVHNKPDIGLYETVKFNGVCRICKHIFGNLKRFNRHIKDMHKDRLSEHAKPLTEIKSTTQVAKNLSNDDESQENDESDPLSKGTGNELVKGGKIVTKKGNKPRFMCIKCKTYYTSRGSILQHQRKCHRGEKIIKSLFKNMFSNPVKPPVSKLQFSDNLVPKNCIFKCEKCGLYIVKCWSAILHSCVDLNTLSRYQCDICFKQFLLSEANIHQQQHKYNDAFNIYSLSQNMHTSMLFWCQKCAVYFEIRKIQNHMSTCNGTSSSIRCQVCKIDVNDILTHMNNHKIHADNSEFIYIDDLIPSGVGEENHPESLKRKLPLDSEPGPSKMRKLDTNEFMYCAICRTFMKLQRKGSHVTGECINFKSKKNCVFCGLLFFAGSPINCHEELHIKSSLDFKQFKFLNVADSKPIMPHIPDFPKCDKCETHDFSTHKCGSSKNCKLCNLKFSKPALKLHLIHHKYLKEDKEVNELIKKYETLASTWHILYQCKLCKVATDSYDDVVLHCQNHYNNIDECATRSCEACSLKLEETCFKRHKRLHSTSITRESFKTVMYDYKNLLNEDWLKLFGNLSEAEVHQIVSRSIYVTRFVKMKLILDGPPELTIYKCQTCKLYVDPQSIYNHTIICKTGQDLKAHVKTFTCDICLIPFSNETARKLHKALHATPNITANSFRIVAFNDLADRKFNAKLEVDDEAFEFKTRTPINAHSINKTDKSLQNVVFYQCRQCKCCSPNPESLVRHTCPTEDELEKCNNCQLVISTENVKTHRKWHKENPNITKDTVKTVMIDNKVLTKRKHVGDEDEQNKIPIKKTVHKLYQCKKCKLCYSFWVRHEVCSPRRRRCKKCGYLFSLKSYDVHKLWHDRYKKATHKDIKVVALSAEMTAQSKAYKREFMKSIKTDRRAKQKQRKENTVDRTPIPKLKKPNAPSKSSEHSLTLYQCQCCKICSIMVSFVKKHTICPSNNRGVFTCKICDLKFKYIGMKYHNAWHRDNKNAARKHIRILTFKGMKLLKVKDKTEPKSKAMNIPSNISYNSEGYTCKICGASSKKSIFVKKHVCKSIPEKPKPSSYLYYQCQGCGICVTSKRHTCISKHRIRTCPRCKLRFSQYNMHDHIQKHALYKDMTRGKITVVPFLKSPEDDISEEETRPVDKVSTVYRCSCGLHFISQKTIERHFAVCSSDNEIPSENCSKCDLLFPTNHLVSHLVNHHSYGKGNIEVKTIPTITLYRCSSCKCVFTNEMRLMQHTDCDSDKAVQCSECDLSFYETEMKTHMETHRTSSDLNKQCRIVTIHRNAQKLDNIQSVNDETDSIENADLYSTGTDALDDKTNLSYIKFGVNYDNFLYKCKYCTTHYLKEDTLYKHFQRNQCLVDNKVICAECGLQFSHVSLSRHMDVQHKKMNLKLEDFVITICEKKCITDMNTSVKTEPEVEEVDNSGNITDLFKCKICSVHFLDVKSFDKHFSSRGVHNVRKNKCPHCRLSFPENVLERHVTDHHIKMNLSLKNFRIVDKLKDTAKIEETDVRQIDKGENVSKDVSQSETAEDIIYYHCMKCKIHFTHVRSIDLHFENNHRWQGIETCDICGLSFMTLVKHKQHHEGKTSGRFLIQDVNDDSDCVNKVYKCADCNAHFTRVLTLINHKLNHMQVNTSKFFQNCPDCGLLFSKKTLRIHKSLHHDDNSFKLEDLVIDTSIGKYRTHKFGVDDNNTVSQSSLEEVITDFNDSIDKIEDANTETDVTEAKSGNKSPECSTKLYKCGKCNVYFLTQATCYKHIIKHAPMDPKEYIECKLCSFQFRIVSLNTHIRKHHKTDFAFDKVLIEEYQPKADDEKAPKIDIYYAKDKVQSRLISTTTDNVDSAEVSQSEVDLTDPDASNDSKEPVILTNIDKPDSEKEDSKNVMVKIPSFTDIKDEEDVKFDVETNEVSKTNEVTENANVIEAPSNGVGVTGKDHPCRFCSESFVSRRAKDFHESLDHLDALKDCPICKKSFNTSVLNELHLQIKNKTFTCCVCSQDTDLDMLPQHSYIHTHVV